MGMQIRVCMAKLHRVTVTDANLDYVGSITIDQALLDASGIKPYQMVIINNLSNAATWQTYVLAGAKGKGEIILNGPPARLFQKGDIVVILAEAFLEPKEFEEFESKMVFVDAKNNVTDVKTHKGGEENK